MMTAADVIDLYNELQGLGINVWIDGGWGVDALLGAQTREHSDLDIAIQQKDVPALVAFLQKRGYQEVRRDDEWSFVLSDAGGRAVDVHAFVFDAQGSVAQGIMYPSGSLTGTGAIGSHMVRCISAECMVKFHSGYPLQEKDFRDVYALCEKFGLELPQEYVDFKTPR